MYFAEDNYVVLSLSVYLILTPLACVVQKKPYNKNVALSVQLKWKPGQFHCSIRESLEAFKVQWEHCPFFHPTLNMHAQYNHEVHYLKMFKK